MKKVECLRLGIFQVNCYFLHNGNHILCIDPGANIKKIQQYLEQYPDSVLDGICLGTGTGSTKKDASQEAAQIALQKMAVID